MAVSQGHADEPELPDLHIGDHVTDAEDPSVTMLVVKTLPDTCEEYHVDDVPLADHNPSYPADDSVVEIVYPKRTDVSVPGRTYAFPRSRLQLVNPIHDFDGAEEEDR